MKNKIYKLLIFILFFLLTSLKLANAGCDFKIKIGENVSKGKNIIDTSDHEELILKNYFTSLKSICPKIISDESMSIKYSFIEDELATIEIIVHNEDNNTASNKLLLMNYVKRTYGNFDTGKNPKIYNHFISWKKNNKIIIYSRLRDRNNIIQESLFITNNKYRKKMYAINKMREEGLIE